MLSIGAIKARVRLRLTLKVLDSATAHLHYMQFCYEEMG